MTSPSTTGDANFRTPMVFDSDNMPSISVQGIGNSFDPPKNGGVEQQLKDKNSLLNFYRRIIKTKLQNPEISRGRITGVCDFDDDAVGAFYTEYDGSKVLIIHNFDTEETKTLDITGDMIPDAVIAADLIAPEKGKTELKDGKLTLSPHSSVVIRSKEKTKE